MISELKFLVPWGHLAAKAWGSPKGRPVICLHGWQDNANTFSRLIPLLPKDCYYMAVDLGGHGLSSHRPAGSQYHFIDYVSDVRRAVAALNWSQFSLMGHSLGGIIAGLFACIFPEMVDKLILLDSYGPGPKDWEKMLKTRRKSIENLLGFEANQQHSPKARSPEEALQRLLEVNEHLTEEAGKILLQRGAMEVSGGLVYNRDVRTTMQIPWDENINILKTIQADVLLIRAQNGFPYESFYTVPEDQVQETFRTFLKERFHFVRVAGNHYVHLNEPEVVAGIIGTFLNKDQHLKANL